MTSELLPCPFCGGEAQFMSITYHPQWYVECKECMAVSSIWGSEQEAIDAWNTRAERTCKPVATDFVFIDSGHTVPACSLCGEHMVKDIPNYCPNCGARVEGD